jgi:hypothetical protein
MIELASALESHAEVSLDSLHRLSFRQRSITRDQGSANQMSEDDSSQTQRRPVKVRIVFVGVRNLSCRASIV